jgi:hypothetical protein
MSAAEARQEGSDGAAAGKSSTWKAFADLVVSIIPSLHPFAIGAGKERQCISHVLATW